MARHRYEDHTLKKLRQRKYRLRGGRGARTQFIPDADSDFAHMARTFANHVEENAARFGLAGATEQVAKLRDAVAGFRDALAKTMQPDTCGPKATRTKNEAGRHAKDAVRAVARMLRGVDESLTSVDRMMLNLPERGKRAKRRECPQIAPVLTFKGSTDPYGTSGAGGGRHILEYGNDFDYGSNVKPRGAARLELFVGLVPPEWAAAREVPTHPDQLSGRELWYLRSFSTSRFEVQFPVLVGGTPMLVVYWGRWADARGGVGPFSKTCVARVEGGMAAPLALPGAQRKAFIVEHRPQQIESKVVFLQTPHQLPDHLDGDEAVDVVAAERGRLLPGSHAPSVAEARAR